MTPRWLRPATDLRVSVSDLTGAFFARSLKSATSYSRRAGDVGLYFLIAISALLVEVDRLALAELHDRLLPVLGLGRAAAHAADAAAYDHRVHLDHRDLEQR